MRDRPYQVCRFCVMDSSSIDTEFDASGRCNHCKRAVEKLAAEVFLGSEGERRQQAIVEQIKAAGKGKEYDSILGISGGVDSSYVALRARALGLRPLAVHLDNGWNDELAVGNIERIVRTLDLDLITHVVDWEEIRDLQRAFLLASVRNVEAITDQAITAVLFDQAARRGIRYILSGSNQATESIVSKSTGHFHSDTRVLRAIHRRFGSIPLRTYPIQPLWRFGFRLMVRRIRWISLLNYEVYDKASAITQLQSEVGYVPYARKHGESKFTRFFQEYILPTKFGYDKRRDHLSSLICSGQLTRKEALERLEKPLYTQDELEIDLDYVTKKLGFTRREFDEIVRSPGKSHRDYPSHAWLYDPANPRLFQAIRKLGKGLGS